MTSQRYTANPSELSAVGNAQGESRSTQLGEFTVDFGTVKAGFKVDEVAYAGQPDDACQCPHFGYLVSGLWHVEFMDGTEATIRGGDAYNLPPGHHFEVLEDSEFIEFSPKEKMDVVLETIAKNIGFIQAPIQG